MNDEGTTQDQGQAPEQPPDAQTEQEQQAPLAVCGVVFFLMPNGGGVRIHGLEPGADPVERRTTPTDIRCILNEVGQKLQADMVVAAFAHQQRAAQEAMINEQIRTAAMKGNGKPHLGLVDRLRGRRR